MENVKRRQGKSKSISSDLEKKISNFVEEAQKNFQPMNDEKRKAKLYKALFHYRGNVDGALTEFRKKISESGYEGIDKKLIPIVEAFGTTKDKTALAIHAHFDVINCEDTKPIITRKEADEVKESVRIGGRKEMVEFMNWLSIYDSIRFIIPHFKRVKFGFYASSYQSAIYLQMHEWQKLSEKIFNSFSAIIDPNQKESLMKLVDDYNSYLKDNFIYGKLEEKTDLEDISGNPKWVDIEAEDSLKTAEYINERCKENLSILKGGVEAIEDWIKDNQADMFVSMAIRRLILNAKTFIIGEIHSKYYHSNLTSRIAEGETPTEEEKKLATYPVYEEVECSEKSYKYFYQRLDGYRQTYQ